ncbi:MAG: hypothetical protein A3I29_02070 [Candidatus Magasanikbacteria bacterium RIFCSPLOWO2_02_FULL_44_11]|uniref:Undecaprenyl-phosphate alpha-N-acetylglucosaminyl 1-phosphate transferase n=2 Tax=Candidatus Magasanikiibacteriota TaxID=1752731 RepID=A0A1F6NAE9_9BACT|nr:MAG: hypothetical protein A3D53_03430 [Candidatus Magasanikbacteria bacterium RIFCSPHIGHO2_02_FULL_45_10]OGH80831.1 MAG: hypothetical protein A3I29_02070 [Candidatus Magasanikbacteria bacterium RIFCSPLOWO2_02_FULL_44_11]
MLIYFAAAGGLSAVLTCLVMMFAKRRGILDRPDQARKKHTHPVPLLGGAALFIGFWAIVGYLVYHPIFGIELLRTKLFAAFLGSSILFIVGIFDDVYTLSTRLRFLVIAFAALVTVLGGLGLEKITNPLGGVISLEQGKIVTVFGSFFILADGLVFLWLLSMMFTTKLLDGLDGLATGVVFIGSLIVFFMTTMTKFYQPNVALVSLIFAGTCLGFLFFNFSPAKIFLGESGSLFIGFMLGVLAVIAGSKVATAFLVLAIPILDVARVVYLRLKQGQSIFRGDRNHLHFTLVDGGLSERKVVLLFYVCALVFGLAALFLQSMGKVIALAVIFVGLLFVALHFRTRSASYERI